MIFKNFFTFVALLGVAVISSANDIVIHDKNHHGYSECRNMRDADVQANCFKLERMDRKLNKMLRVLTNDGHRDRYGLRREYACLGKAKIYGNDELFAGYGKTSEEALTSYYKSCNKRYTKSACGRLLKGCDVEEFPRQTYFYCEVKKFKGVGRTKKEAKSQAISTCKVSGYMASHCEASFKGCSRKN